MSRKSTLLGQLALLAPLVLITACSLDLSASQAVFPDHDQVHAHAGKAIPVSPGTPKLGQQPLIPADPSIAGRPMPLTLLYTADIHSRVDPFPRAFYHTSYAGKGGFARIASLAREIKRTTPHTLLLDSGDYLQGTPYFNFFKGQVEAKALTQVGFDAVTIGNHEFDEGVPALRQALSLFKGPVITSNVTFSPELGQRYAVIKAGNLRVGLFGLLTDVRGLVTPPNFQTARYYDPVAVARQTVAKLRQEADVVVCMSHVGIVPPWSETDEGDPEPGHITDERIAELVPGIDVILSGHTHAMVKRPLVKGNHRTLIVAPGYGGGFLGRLDLQIKDGKVVQYENDLLPLTDRISPAPDVEALIAPYRAKMGQVLDRRIGTAVGTFSRYSGQDRESSLNNLIADATLSAARKLDPTVAFGLSSSGTPRNFITEGPIRVEDVYYALPFDNKLVIVEGKGQVILDMLSTQRRQSDNRRHAVANVTYSLNPATGAISDVLIGGQPFDPNRTYKVAVNDYMADGGSGFSMIPSLKRTRTNLLQRDALIAHIEATKTLIPQVGRIRLGSGAAGSRTRQPAAI